MPNCATSARATSAPPSRRGPADRGERTKDSRMSPDGTARGKRNNHDRPTKPEDVPVLTDQYFLKTKEVVRRFGDRRATYAVFMRRPVICTPRLLVDFLEAMAADRGTKFDIELNYEEGHWVGAGEPMMYISGSLHHLVDLETLFLQKLGAPCVAAY